MHAVRRLGNRSRLYLCKYLVRYELALISNGTGKSHVTELVTSACVCVCVCVCVCACLKCVCHT